MSEIVLPELSAIEKIFKSLVWDNFIKGFLIYIFGAAIMSTPVLGDMIRAAALALGGIAYRFAVLNVDITTIKILNSQGQRAFDDASIKLAVLAHDYGEKSDEFIKARDVAARAQSQFTQFHR